MKVQEFMLGNTKIEIHDDAYIRKTKEDIDKILEQIAKIISNTLARKNF